MKKLHILLVAVVCNCFLHGQSYHAVKHFSGTQTINGIEVTVTSIGSVDSLMVSGEKIGPYFIGKQNGDVNENGRITFQFSKPVSEVTFSFSGVSDIDNHYEEIIFLLNDHHYSFQNHGTKSEYEPMALINKDGNIVGCSECSISGWNESKIKGPINSITIIDSVISGLPNGTIFSLAIGDPCIQPQEPIVNTLINYHYKINEFAAGNELVIEAAKLNSCTITIQNKQGKIVPIEYKFISTNEAIINISSLPRGEYKLIINSNSAIESQRFLIE